MSDFVLLVQETVRVSDVLFSFLQGPVGYTFIFIYGAVIGSFLNVVIYRLHTGRSLAGRSHCLSCGHSLRWFELFPLISYIFLRGRCRRCGAIISSRYFLVELSCGLLFVLVLSVSTAFLPLLLLLAVLSVLLVILVYDLQHFIIPDELVLWLVGLALTVTAYDALLSASWQVVVTRALGGALAASSFYFLLWLISRGRWLGLGDAKLAVPLGMIIGLPAVFSFVVLSFWVGAAVSVSWLFLLWLWRRGQTRLRFVSQTLTMKGEVPFAPFLIVAFLLVYIFDVRVLPLFDAFF